MLDASSWKRAGTESRIVSVGQDNRLSATIIHPKGPVSARPLLALHGISREARKLVECFAPEAQAAGRILIVPRFAGRPWPVFQRITKRHRADRALLTLIADLRLRGIVGPGPLDLFGYSGGAQLAHRFAMLHPEQVGDLHLGAPGWFTLPDRALPYPIGFGPSRRGDARWGRRMESGLRAYLDRRITLYVGTKDNDPDDIALRRTAQLDAAQGTTRLDRARFYAELISTRQADLGLGSRCVLRELPGCGHDFRDCAQRGGMAGLVARPDAQN